MIGNPRYYKTEATRLSYGEVWRWGNPMTFVLFAVRKLLGWRMTGPLLVPAAVGIEHLEGKGIPASLRSSLQSTIDEAEMAGFEFLFFYSVPTVGPSTGLAAALLSEDRRAVALATVARTPPIQDIGIGLLTKLMNGRYLATGSGGHRLKPPPVVDGMSLPGRRAFEIIAAHMARIRKRENDVVPLAASEVESLIEELQRLQLDYNVSRGVYVPASEADLTRWGIGAHSEESRG
jgi:hypothetical protein